MSKDKAMEALGNALAAASKAVDEARTPEEKQQARGTLDALKGALAAEARKSQE